MAFLENNLDFIKLFIFLAHCFTKPYAIANGKLISTDNRGFPT